MLSATKNTRRILRWGGMMVTRPQRPTMFDARNPMRSTLRVGSIDPALGRGWNTDLTDGNEVAQMKSHQT